MKHYAPTRRQQARDRYDAAYRALLADRDAGLVSPAAAKVRFDAIYSTYQTERDDAELGAFLRGRGLGFIADRVEGGV